MNTAAMILLLLLLSSLSYATGFITCLALGDDRVAALAEGASL